MDPGVNPPEDGNRFQAADEGNKLSEKPFTAVNADAVASSFSGKYEKPSQLLKAAA